MAAKVVQFAGQTSELILVITQSPLHVANILPGTPVGKRFEAQMALDDVPGDRRPQQARQIDFHLIPQPPQLIRPELDIG